MLSTPTRRALQTAAGATALAILALPSPAFSQAAAPPGQLVADGFYLLSADESAPSVSTPDGKRLSLGSRQEIAIESSVIHAENNANSRFWVTLGIDLDAHAQASSYVLVVSNRGYPWAGSGSGPDTYSMSFRVPGTENALDVSRYLKTPIVYRRHPGHELLVSFTPTRASFRKNDRVTVTFRVENVGTNTIRFSKGGRYRGSTRDNQYTFSARLMGRQVQDIGSNIHFGGIAGTPSLEGGEAFEDTIDLGKWFAFEEAGTYEILGSYEMTYYDPSPEMHRVIWTDYVSGAFVVKID
jgi:hypothetical protein